MTTLEEAFRGARNLGKLNLFRNRARGGWEAAAARIGSETGFVVGIDDDPAEAVLKALHALAAASGSGSPVSKPLVAKERRAEDYAGGVFG